MVTLLKIKLQDKKSFTHMAYSVFRNNLFSSAVMFLSSIILIRALPKDDYGLYVLTLAFFAFFELLLAGTDASLIRFIPTSGKKVQHQLIATVLTIKIIIMLLIVSSLLISYNLSATVLHIPASKLDTYSILYSIITISLIFQFISTTVTTIINSFMLYDVLFKLTIFNSLSSLFVAGLVSFFHLYIWEYVLLSTIFSFIYVLFSIYMLNIQNRLSYKTILLSVNKIIIRTTIQNKILSYSLPLLGVSMLSYIKNYLPSYLFGTMVSLDTLAVYTIFKRITDFLHKGYAGFIQSLSPKLFKMIDLKTHNIDKLFLIGLLSRIIIFVFICFGYNKILQIYKIEESSNNLFIFIILSSLFLMNYFGTFAVLKISALKSTKEIFISSLFMNTFSILLIPAFYFLLGIKGIILGEAISKYLGFYILIQKGQLFDNKMIKNSYFILLLSTFFLILFTY